MQTHYDDLTVIKGIGRARQTWLRETLHVHTLHDLAGISPDDLAARLKADRRPIKPDVAESWIAQARTLTASAAPAAPPQTAKIYPPPQAVHAEPAVEPLYFGAFSHTLQARLAKMDRLAADRRVTPRMTALTGQAYLTREALHIETLQVRIFQPPDTLHISGTPEQIIACLLRGGVPFRMEVFFVLTGPADRIEAITAYHTAVYARDLFGGGNIYLGEMQSIADVAELSFRKLALPDMLLPPGMYRVQLTVALEGAAELVYLGLPLLQVV